MDNKPQDLFSAIAAIGATEAFFLDRPNSAPLEITVRPLTGEEAATSEAFFDGIYPPPLFEDFPGDSHTPPSKKKIGNDTDDPAYLEKINKAAEKQQAFIALRGVLGLSDQDSLKDCDINSQIALVQKRWPKPLIRLIASKILRFEVKVADKAEDLLTSDSDASTSSDASATKSATGSSAKAKKSRAAKGSTETTTKDLNFVPADGGEATSSATG